MGTDIGGGRNRHRARVRRITTIPRPLAVAALVLSLAAWSCAPAGPELVELVPRAAVDDRVPVGDGLEILRSTVTTTVAPDPAPSSIAPRRPIERLSGLPTHLRVRAPDPTGPVLDPVVGPSPAAPAPPPLSTAPPPPPAPDPTEPPTTTTPSTATTPPSPTTIPPEPSGGAGAEFVASVNGLRAAAGLAALSRSSDLDARAQAWTEHMAGAGDFRHSTIINDLVAGGWSIAGENLGYGPSVGTVFAALTESPGHHANMVNAAFTAIGVGVVVRDGVVWTTHLFAG